MTEALSADDFADRVTGQVGRNKGFRKWLVNVYEQTGEVYFSSSFYALGYSIYQKINTRDDDHFTVIVGDEGSGKSLVNAQLCAIVSPDTFRMKSVVYEFPDFIRAIKHAKPGESIMVDEGALMLFSREAMRKENKTMVKLMQLVRQKCLHICICIPYYDNLDSYIRDKRTDTLIRVVKRGAQIIILKDGVRGINMVYPRKYSSLATVPRKYYQGKWSYGTNRLAWPEINDFNEAEYRKRKKENLDDTIAEIEDALTPEMVKEEDDDGAVQKRLFSMAEVEEITGLHRRTVINKSKEDRFELVKVGQKYMMKADDVDKLVAGELF